MSRNKADLIYNLSDAEKKTAHFVDHNTIEYVNTKGNRTIRLHDTDIIEFLPRKKVKLNSGGWLTMTTKGRMNGYLPKTIGILQDNKKWFVSNKNGDHIPFFDGMVVPLEWTMDSLPKNLKTKSKSMGKKTDAIHKSIQKYCDAMRKYLKKNPVPLPNAGDCWDCYFQASDLLDKHFEKGIFKHDLKPNERKLPGIFGHPDHLREHLKETYIHGSIIFNAAVYKGYNCPGIVLYRHENKIPDQWTIDIIVRSVRSYLRANLEMPL